MANQLSITIAREKLTARPISRICETSKNETIN